MYEFENRYFDQGKKDADAILTFISIPISLGINKLFLEGLGNDIVNIKTMIGLFGDPVNRLSTRISIVNFKGVIAKPQESCRKVLSLELTPEIKSMNIKINWRKQNGTQQFLNQNEYPYAALILGECARIQSTALICLNGSDPEAILNEFKFHCQGELAILN